MSVAIRLARGGAKKKPHYRLVVADKRVAVGGKFIEAVGRYDPMLAADDPLRFTFDKQRVEHWLKVGAQASRRAQILLAKQGAMPKPEISEQSKQHLAKKGTLEKLKQKEEKQRVAAAAKTDTPKQETPKQEAKEEAKEEVSKQETPEQGVKQETPQTEAKEEVKEEIPKEDTPKQEVKQEAEAAEPVPAEKSAAEGSAVKEPAAEESAPADPGKETDKN